MAVTNKTIALRCSGVTKRCNNKTTKETNEETAFKHAEKQGWTKVIVTKKCTKYYCAKCSHKLSLAV